MSARKLRGAVACALALALMLGARGAHAVPAATLSARAQAAAQRGEWNTAARAFEELTAAGIDGSDVLFDLGTAYAHAGRYGEALWRLEQVARRSPLALDARQNLRAARLALAHRDAARSGRAVVETAVPFADALAELVPLDWAVTLALLGELAVALALFARRRAGAGEVARVAGATVAVLGAALALAFGAVVLARAVVPTPGVVLRDGLHLLQAPTADAMGEALVREGERVVLGAREGVFVRVRTPAGASGWLALRDVGPLDE